MSDTKYKVAAGWFLGMLTAACLCYLPGGLADGRKAKEACELKLPRNQECKIVAVPKESSDAQ